MGGRGVHPHLEARGGSYGRTPEWAANISTGSNPETNIIIIIIIKRIQQKCQKLPSSRTLDYIGIPWLTTIPESNIAHGRIIVQSLTDQEYQYRLRNLRRRQKKGALPRTLLPLTCCRQWTTETEIYRNWNQHLKIFWFCRMYFYLHKVLPSVETPYA